MNKAQQDAITHCEAIINSNVDKEEIAYYLSERFSDFKPYFDRVSADHGVKVSDMLLFLKDVPDSFKNITLILGDDCAQDFLVKALTDYVSVNSIETDADFGDKIADVSNPPASVPHNYISIHRSIVDGIVDEILHKQKLEILVSGPVGCGKSTVISDVSNRLQEHGYGCVSLDIKLTRFANLLAELDSFIRREMVFNSMVVFIDSCRGEDLSRLRSGSEFKDSIYEELLSKKIPTVIVTEDSSLSRILSNSSHYEIPPCTGDQLKLVIGQSFDVASRDKLVGVLPNIQFPKYPLHATLIGTLFISVGGSHMELINAVPTYDEETDFISEILKKIIECRRNIDEVYLIAAILLFQDMGGASKENIMHLLCKYQFTEDRMMNCLEKLQQCRLVISKSDNRYFLLADFSQLLLTFSDFSGIWYQLLAQFCLHFLRITDSIVSSISENKDISENKTYWVHMKKFMIKSITYPLQKEDSYHHVAIFKYRCRITAKLRTLWQARLLTVGESVDVYESVLSLIDSYNSNSDDILRLKRTIFIHYMSLFFYFQKIEESGEIISDLFTHIHQVQLKLNIKDELYCELISHIIEYKIHAGQIEEAIGNLKILMMEQQNLHLSKDNVALTKIRLAQLKILHKDSETFEFDSESLSDTFSATPLGKPQMINARIRISRGDMYYMNTDFVTAAWNYEMALYGIDDIRPHDILMKNETNKLQQQILCRLGNLGLQSSNIEEIQQSLKHFKKCQELYEAVEIRKKYHKYFVFAAVAYLLLNDNSNALYEMLDYVKYAPHKPVFIAVTNLDAQKIISKNLQERLEGHELQHIDNHVYQGKVNVLHLTYNNYEWIKTQVNEEFIEITTSIPDKVVRANILQFPSQLSQSNKCLVVVFHESSHHRTYSDRTNISEQTNISLSSFRTELVDPESDDEAENDGNEDSSSRPSSTLVDAVFHNSLDIAKEVIEKAKTDFLKNLTSSIFDRLF